MPIINYKGQMQIEFGTGDIKVSPGLLQMNEQCAVVVFQQQEPKEIGKRFENAKKVLEPEDAQIRMTFDKVASIDVVIWALQEAKRMIQEESWQTLLGTSEEVNPQ